MQNWPSREETNEESNGQIEELEEPQYNVFTYLREFLHSDIRSTSRLERSDISAFIESVTPESCNRGRAISFLTGDNFSYKPEEGDRENLEEYLRERLVQRTETPYDELSEFKSDFRAAVDSEQFPEFSSNTVEFSPSAWEEDLEYLAERFLNEGERTEILGVSHYKLRLDEETEAEEEKPVSRQIEVINEKIDKRLDRYYRRGFIGRKTNSNRATILTMRDDLVEEYAGS